MQWTANRPFVPPPLADRLDRLRLRRHALRYAAHGWAVTPGACLAGHRFACGRPGCPIMMCHPALESWEDTASTDPGLVSDWWRRRPYSVLLATGGRLDALEVPAALGLRVLGAARLHRSLPGAGRADALGPVAVTAAGRWMFLVRPGEPLRSELDHRLDVVRHGCGSWIPAPPSRMLEGPVRWAVPPERTQWRLPAPALVQTLMADALGATPAPRPVVPRQLSTARRGT
ncbi:bifunctional DNA primase/polymerase [Paractinoplanes rhizophilus]|uniref:Bifunctional DNA primase/polymerase n=1 Tax=Paractinoplanes rhizophilus TaxID=1416877 RepID=A0ABW2HJR0_9ACTN|nr:bifunctional DNA primase/polymerase [Actinoplanes sp.]